MTRFASGISFAVAWALGLGCLTTQIVAAEQVVFVRDVQPILTAHCYDCHAGGSAEGGIRWDRKSALLGGDSGRPSLVPRKPEESRLIHLVRGDDGELMPPEDEGEPLSEKQIDVLVRWIQQGADWPETAQTSEENVSHWSFVPPQPHKTPQVQQTDWPRNFIDNFVLARVEQEGLAPSAEADRYTLCRRLYLDVIGIPPTPEEVDAFVQDDSAYAYEKLVDRLLDSERYGERWARMWLDLARYADTQGYEKDNRRTIWRYRDWVINAFNRDLPFDQFTIEQIAGDLLPNATTEQRIATAFHRNTMTNTEGGTDNEEFRTAAVVDRVNTTGQVWLGLTVGCAQCHSHKYDPITQREYYQLFAFLNQSEDADRDDEVPTMRVPKSLGTSNLDTAVKEIEQLREKLNTPTPELAAAEAAWAERLTANARQTPPTLGPWHLSGPFQAADFNEAHAKVFPPESAVDLDAEYEGGLKWNLRKDLYDATIHNLKGESCATYLYRTIGAPDSGSFTLGFGSDDGIKVWVNGHLIHDKKVGRPVRRDDDRVTVELTAGENTLLVKISNAGGRSGFFFRPIGINVPDNVKTIVKVPADQRDQQQREALSSYYRTISPILKPDRDRIAELEKHLDADTTTVPVMRELAAHKRRLTHVMIRGSFLSKGAQVEPAVPEALHDFPSDAERDRMGLARWLVDRNNPLTARVVVNRYWEKLFGRGLVETSEDFGTQGTPPSHPELLDRLAIQFMDSNWSMKALVKLIVTSAAYRQASSTTEQLVQRDRENRLLARGPRFRLEAEMVRDQALAAAGLLSAKMYGPSVMPPQPDGVWQIVYSGDSWKTSNGEDKYRRGLYTFWRRTSPYPSMMAFDATSREVCTVRRIRTNTPLAALVTLNDPAFVEAAQQLARLVVAEQSDINGQAISAFRRCLVRVPRDEELSRILALYRSELAHYEKNPDAARQMAGEVPDDINAAVLAAWTVVGNVLLNLDETLTKM